MFERKAITVLGNSRTYLQQHFAWPKDESDNWFTLKYFLFACISSPLLSEGLVHMIVELHGKNGADINLDISIIISLVGTYYYSFYFVMNIRDICEGCKMLSDCETFGKPKDFEATNDMLNRISKMHFIAVHIGLILFMITPFSEYRQCQETNQEKNLREICGLIPIWLPFDIDYFPAKQIVFLIQAFSAKYTYITASIMNVFVWECFEHLVIRMRHVGEKFVDAVNQNCYEKRRYHLNRAIEYHNFVLRCADLLIESFKASIFLFILQTGMLFGCLGYQFLTSPHMATCAILCGYLNCIIIISVVGEKIAHESREVGNAIYYNTKWYSTEVDIQKDLTLVLLRSQKPVYIKAGPMAVMTHSTILSILKSAYSVLPLLEAIS